jgi:hypothetical protein
MSDKQTLQAKPDRERERWICAACNTELAKVVEGNDLSFPLYPEQIKTYLELHKSYEERHARVWIPSDRKGRDRAGVKKAIAAFESRVRELEGKANLTNMERTHLRSAKGVIRDLKTDKEEAEWFGDCEPRISAEKIIGGIEIQCKKCGKRNRVTSLRPL